MNSECVHTDGEFFLKTYNSNFSSFLNQPFSSFTCRLLKKQFFHRALKVMKKKPEKDTKKEKEKEKEKEDKKEKEKAKGDSSKEEEKKGKKEKEKKKESEVAETKKEKSVREKQCWPK